MKQKIALAAVTLVVAAGVWKILGNKEAESSLTSSDSTPDSAKPLRSVAKPVELSQKQSSEMSESIRKKLSQPIAQSPHLMNTKPMDPKLIEDLKAFQLIQSKPFPTEAEAAQKKELLQDSQFLKQAGALLTDLSLMENDDYLASENAAIDVLLEALRSGNRAASEEVIWTVVRDQQVESSLIPQKHRETLAGIKGELLYHATAHSFFPADRVPAALPGPVSARIWSNVQDQQQANLAESTEEAKAHEAKWKKGS